MGVTLYSTKEIGRQVADRVRRLRLDLGWSQAELATRAGLAVKTYSLFEQTGRISLERLIQVSRILGRAEDWGALFAPRPPRSLDEIEAGRRVRQRGRRRTAGGAAKTVPAEGGG